MSLKYTCPGCGTPLGYDGLCWKCKCEQERKTALAWTPEQIAAKQKNLIQNIHRLADMEDPECTDFWQLLGYRDASGRRWPLGCSGPVRSIITLPLMWGRA